MQNKISASQSRSYERYRHNLIMAYRLIGGLDCSHLIPSLSELTGDSDEVLTAAYPTMRNRLSQLGPQICAEFLERPFIQRLYFGSHILNLPIANKEGLSWYTNDQVMNYDFLTETFIGMHHNARVIYDFGGHQGVFALYYSKLIPAHGRVYTFEPSIVNIEILSLSLYINQADNVILMPLGIGTQNQTLRSDMDGLLVAGAPTNMLLMRPDWAIFERPDFIKIDIEGFEHELISAMPWLFYICDNIHLEIHVPHLVNRGIDYKDTFSKIPFDKFRVRRAEWGRLTDITADTDLEGYATLLLTAKNPEIQP